MGYSPWGRKELDTTERFHFHFHWSKVLFPTPGYLSDPRIEPVSPALAGRFFTTEPPEEPTTTKHLGMEICALHLWG